MDVPIHILEKDSVIINFEGRGMNALSTSANISIEHSDAKTQEHRAQKGPFPGQASAFIHTLCVQLFFYFL